MATYCDNPLCLNEVAKQLCPSMESPSDGRPVLCGTCRQAYAWGTAHGGMTAVPEKLWIAAVTSQGDIVHAQAVTSKDKAVKALAEYFKTEDGYVGPAELPGICAWLAEYDEHLGIEIFAASLNTAGENSCSCDGPDNPKAQRGLVIDPPPREEGPEPLYRAVYAIDVNAGSAQEAAERAYQIMVDSQSMRPVLEVLDHSSRCVRVDLSRE